MRKNKLKQMFKDNEPVINGWLQIPHSFSAEVMAKQGWVSFYLTSGITIQTRNLHRKILFRSI